MKSNYKKHLTLLFVGLGSFACVWAMGEILAPKEAKTWHFEHHCTWEECDHQGDSVFVHKWAVAPGSDGERCEMLHFNNPQLSYEEAEFLILNFKP